MTKTEVYEATMSGSPLCDIGQIPKDAKRLLASEVRCGNLRKFRAPFCFIPPYGFTGGTKTYYCCARGMYGRDWTHELLMEYIRHDGEKRRSMLAEHGIVPSEEAP
jgi:hypothetical protein